MQKRKTLKYLSLLFLFVVVFYPPISLADITCSGDSISPDVSLRSPGRPLQSMQVQDQDGLGTCAANALSLAMEVELGTPVSYHQIAINYGKKKNSKTSRGRTRAVIKRDEDNQVDEIFVEGGEVCGAFNIMHARTPRTICRKKDVTIENLQVSDDQERIMKNLSEFYDSFTKFKNRHKKAASKFAESLRDAISNSQATAPSRCQQLHDNPNRISEDLKEHLENFCAEQYLNLKDTNEYILKLQNELKELPTSTGETQDIDLAQRRDELEEKITRAEKVALTQRNKVRAIGNIKKDEDLLAKPDPTTNLEWHECKTRPSLDASLKDHVAAIEKTFNLNDDVNPAAKMRPLVDAFLAKNISKVDGAPDFPAEIFKMSSGAPFGEDYLQRLFERDISKTVPAFCKKKIVWRDLQDARVIKRAFYNRSRFCLKDGLLDSTTSAFEGLSVITNGSFPAKELLDALTNVDKGLDDFLMGIAGPGCMTNAIEIPQKLRCEDVTYPTGVSARDRMGKGKKQIAALARQRSAEHLRNYVGESLLQMRSGKGRPVMIGVCSGFLKNDKFDSNFGRNCKEGIEKHGMHEMNIIGYRCRAGKLEYQIQNSWGQSCHKYFTSDTPPRPLYDCDASGGFIWVPENVLVPSIIDVSRLKDS